MMHRTLISILVCICCAEKSNFGALAFTSPPLRSEARLSRSKTTSGPPLLYASLEQLAEQDVETTSPAKEPPSATATSPNEAILLKEDETKPQQRSPLDAVVSMVFGNNGMSGEYQRGLTTIGFITLLFASNSPVLHAAFYQENVVTPPPLLLNAGVATVALVGLLLGGKTLEDNTKLPSTLKQQQQQQSATGQEPQEQFLEQQQQEETVSADQIALRGGCELGLWKFLGTTANIYGLSLTTAAHGAFLIQLTTLIVPVVQGLMGVPIPNRIKFSVVLALAGVVCFTQDPTGTPSMAGDLLCVVAAAFYATYDLRLFDYGKQVAPRRLITGKIATQAILSLTLLFTAGSTSGLFDSQDGNISELSALQETVQYISSATSEQWAVLIPVVLWSGVVVNALAPFLQVGGQQAVGPTRCQTIYASQPLWAAIMSFVVFGETIGFQGIVGGSAFLSALFLAATAEAPDPDCGKKQCEV